MAGHAHPGPRWRRRAVFGLYPFLLKLHADAGYQGDKFQKGLARVCCFVNVEIVRRSDAGQFIVLPRRWIVERTIAWLNRCRRLSKDWECLDYNARFPPMGVSSLDGQKNSVSR